MSKQIDQHKACKYNITIPTLCQRFILELFIFRRYSNIRVVFENRYRIAERAANVGSILVKYRVVRYDIENALHTVFCSMLQGIAKA